MSGLLRFCILVIALGSAMNATVYYVDSTDGSDAETGRTTVTAWRTLSRVNSTRFTAGDYILLKRGGAWQERLIVPSSGQTDVPITIGAYGDGERPVIDGTDIAIDDGGGVIQISGRQNVVVSGIEVRNSRRNGIDVSNCAQLKLRDLVVHNSQGNGILIFNCNAVTIEALEIYDNSMNLDQSWDGIRIDSNRPVSGFLIQDCRIYQNLGGDEWRSANGIFLGHTGDNRPTLRGVRIAGNEIYKNGNPNQNQAGRGISGTLHGDVSIVGNFVHQNASAGVYLSDQGSQLDVEISRNVFYNNALRQFGGFTDLRGRANANYVVVDDPEITAMGTEVGGLGPWEITRNTFWYTTSSTDSFRSFIKINNVEQEKLLFSDYNMFFSGGPRRWRGADDAVLDFGQWQALGFDRNSASPK